MMSEWKDHSVDSRDRWERIAASWDDYMGDVGNAFHREVIRPETERLLAVREHDRVLDIACGNGNFSRRLSDLGAEVVGIDCSRTMIERARARTPGDIRYLVMDASDEQSLLSLGEEGPFDKAVSNMGLMDMAEIDPLVNAVFRLLKPGGAFVFSVSHPCFQSPGARRVFEEEEVGEEVVYRRSVQVCRYIEPESYQGLAIPNQPVASWYFHRPLSSLMNTCFQTGFVADGIAEPTFGKDRYSDRRFEWIDIPPALILRMLRPSG